MNPEAQSELNRILALDPNDVSESDMGFLRARRSYLTEEQRIKFGIDQAASSAASSEETATETETVKPRKAGKSQAK